MTFRVVLCVFTLSVLTACSSSVPVQPPVPGQPAGIAGTATGSTLPAVAELDALYAARYEKSTAEVNKQASQSFMEWLGFLLYLIWVESPEALFGSPQNEITAPSASGSGLMELVTSPATPTGFAIYPIAAPPETRIICVPVVNASGGPLISTNTTPVIGQNGASLIGNKGGGLVSELGSGVIGQNGASLQGNGGTGIRPYMLANFSEQRWEGVDASEGGLIDLTDGGGDPADYRSAAGNIYVAPIIHNRAEEIRATVVGVMGLPCVQGDTTPAPDLTNFVVTPLSNSLHFGWEDLGATMPLMVKVYISAKPFTTGDEPGVVCMNYMAYQREGLFPYPAVAQAFVRARVHNIASCQDGTLTAEQPVTSQAGEMIAMAVSADPLEAEPGQTITLTATGAETYDWDLDDNGSYEIVGDASGVQAIPGNNSVGHSYARVRGNSAGGGIALSTVSMLRRGWITKIIEPGGLYLSMVKLVDGRPAICHVADGVLRYGYPSDLKGAGDWNMQTLNAAPQTFNSCKLVLANGAPVIGQAWVSSSPSGHHFDVYSTPSPLGDTGWVRETVISNPSLRNGEADILGNDHPFSDPSTIVLAYPSEHDDEPDGWPLWGIDVAVGTPDGLGGYDYSTQRVVSDYDGQLTNGEANRPQLARINGNPAMIYNQTPYGTWWRECYYTHATDDLGSTWSGASTQVPELYDVANRYLFDVNGHAAFTANFDRVGTFGGVNYFVSDTLGPALGPLTKLTLAGTEGDTQVSSPFTLSTGKPAILAGYIDNPNWWENGWHFLSSSTPQGAQATDWEPYAPAIMHLGKPGSWAVGVELGDGKLAIAFPDRGATDRKLRYMVSF